MARRDWQGMLESARGVKLNFRRISRLHWGVCKMRATILSAALGAALLLVTGCCNCQTQSTAAIGTRAEVARAQSSTADGATNVDEFCDEDICCEDDSSCRFCNGWGCCHCRPYRIPTNLVYPPQGAMPGIVQYPYYTCKGPDCFFYEPNPIRRQ